MKTKTLQIGITGGIGSGKSMVCKIFQTLGAPVYDADTMAKWLMAHDAKLIRSIKARFGKEAYLTDGTVNRTYLAKQVFGSASELQKLNALVHPRVAEHYQDWVHQHSHFPYVIKEAALLIEAKSYQQLDRLVLVYAPKTLRIQRVLQRDPQRDRKQVEQIIQKQLPEREKLPLAQHILKNDEKEMLIMQVLRLHRVFSETASLLT
ncbi:dephospho-CoA kinase [Rapidithrix thailandica]|uniref:Dephospho-CoA kinase n=1 Tax=Rapidithrix thailandica TaxID=413964 RepID=A0AAW9S5L7_9BACT